MIRETARLAGESFDVLIVGGGIYGLALAYDAALRGLKTALVERHDFGSGTSFNHHRTLHGGVRYLQSFDVGRMRESIRERRTFARIAPSLVSPLGFLMPTHGLSTRSTWAMRAAFTADRLVAWDRNSGVPESHRLPPGRVLSRSEAQSLVPGADFTGTTGAAYWFDYRIDEGDRLTVSFALAAARHGAVLVNYATAIEPLRNARGVVGMVVRDDVTGGRLEVRSALTINAAGASAGRLMAAFGSRRVFPLVKAMNLVTRRPWPNVALARPTRAGRLLVALPWRGRLLVGTSHGESLSGSDDTLVTTKEASGYLSEVNDAFPWLELRMDDVTLVHRGVVPAKSSAGRSIGLLDTPEIHDHARDGIEGALSVVGVKFTTARGVAERAISLACSKLGRGSARAQTAVRPLLEAVGRDAAPAPGAFPSAAVERIRQLYGRAAERIFALAAERPSLAETVDDEMRVTGAEVVHAVREEAALTLDDVVIRRTGIGALGYPGDTPVERCAALMAAELGWNEERMADEQASVREFYEIGNPSVRREDADLGQS
jgi:glycerol-3-phosphate dehydrogenase